MKIAAALLLVQFAIPETLPPLPVGASVCNVSHCLVNADDWTRLNELVFDLQKRARTTQCASVTILEPPKRY